MRASSSAESEALYLHVPVDTKNQRIQESTLDLFRFDPSCLPRRATAICGSEHHEEHEILHDIAEPVRLARGHEERVSGRDVDDAGRRIEPRLAADDVVDLVLRMRRLVILAICREKVEPAREVL